MTKGQSLSTLTAEGLIHLLQVEELDRDLYRGARKPGGIGRVFGGQVVAQALQAAQRSVEPPKAAHSVHACFMRAGDEDLPILFRVVRDFDGRSFASRRVVATQHGAPILTLTCSFQRPEAGMHHQDHVPGVAAPETLAGLAELLAASSTDQCSRTARWLSRLEAVELRPVDPAIWTSEHPRPPFQATWFRIAAPLADDPALHRAALAYVSDMTLLGTSLLPHRHACRRERVQIASLDHALWFHEPFRADQWLLYTCTSPWAGHGRGFNRGQVHARDGRLVASVAQEGLIRRR